MSVLNSTNTNTAALPTEKGEYKSEIANLKPLITTSLNLKSNTLKPEDKRFNQWLAGLIDGDGCFLLSKKGYASLEITMDIRDSMCLYKIKNIYGGSIKFRSNNKAIRYRLHDKKNLINLLNAVNGEIRNSNRILQFVKLCNAYNIEFYHPKPLTYNNY
jgi:hypothetical protein